MKICVYCIVRVTLKVDNVIRAYEPRTPSLSDLMDRALFDLVFSCPFASLRIRKSGGAETTLPYTNLP